MLAVLSPAARAQTDAKTEALYERAVSAAQAGQVEDAAELFENALTRMPERHPLRTLALYGAARANQKVGTAAAACKAADRFKAFLGRADAEPEKREKATSGLADMVALCGEGNGGSGAVDNPAPGSRPGPWVVVGAGGVGVVMGGVLLAMAVGKSSDADSAERASRSALASGDIATANREGWAAEGLASDSQSYGTAGYLAGGLGLAAVAAGIYWLSRVSDSDGEPAQQAVIVPLSSGLGVAGVF